MSTASKTEGEHKMQHRNWRTVLALSLLVVFGSGAATAEANLLENPGFDLGNLESWTELFGNTDIATPGQGGTSWSATMLVQTVTGQDYWSQLIQEEESVNAGDPVYASAYLKTTFAPIATAKAGIMIQFLDVNGNIIGAAINSAQIGGTTDWRYVDLVSTAAPANTDKVRLSVFLWAAQDDQASLTGQMYVDTLDLVKEVRPLKGPKILLNKGFENGLHDWIDLYGFPASLSTDIVRTGTYAAAKQVGVVPGQDYWSQLHQTITAPLFVSANPKFTGYIKTVFVAGSQASAGLLVEFLDVNGIKIGERASAGVSGQTDWVSRSVDLKPTPTGTKAYRLSITVWAPAGDPSGDGTAYYDDMALK